MKIYIVQHISKDNSCLNWLGCFDCVSLALNFIKVTREYIEKNPNYCIDPDDLYILEADVNNFKLLTNKEVEEGL